MRRLDQPEQSKGLKSQRLTRLCPSLHSEMCVRNASKKRQRFGARYMLCVKQLADSSVFARAITDLYEWISSVRRSGLTT
jgi:hypothetical protein